MSVHQDRLTFFGVLIAVVIVVIGYLQLSSLYPIEGREANAAQDTHENNVDDAGEAPREGGALP